MTASPEFNPDSIPLDEQVRRLQSLVDSFALLNSSLDLDTVLLITLNTAQELMKAEIASIALINDEKTHLVFVESTDKNFDKLKNIAVPVGQGIAGNVARTGKPVSLENVHEDSRFYAEVDRALQQTTSSYLCVPLIAEDEIIGTAQLMNKRDGQNFSTNDVALMEGFARQAALAIHNAKMHSVLLKQKAIESELRICGDIQRKLFPESIPEISGFTVFGHSEPCREVGGDYYSCIARPDGSRDVLIADVSGKGLTASMLVSELHSGMQLLSPMEGSLPGTLTTLNRHFYDTFILGKFITLFAARLYPDRDEMEYVLAGHPSPAIVHRDGTVTYLERTAPVLGIVDNLDIPRRSCSMRAGDVMIAYTDGYSEAQSANGDFFGDERIVEFVTSARENDLATIAGQLSSKIQEFTPGVPVFDDQTLLLVRRD